MSTTETHNSHQARDPGHAPPRSLRGHGRAVLATAATAALAGTAQAPAC